MNALTGAAHGLGRLAEGVADIAEGALDAIADLFGGADRVGRSPMRYFKAAAIYGSRPKIQSLDIVL